MNATAALYGRTGAQPLGYLAIEQRIAPTLPEPNASTRILTKHGFRCTGEFDDPGDGKMWEWELPQAP